jgi:hypothetical protein
MYFYKEKEGRYFLEISIFVTKCIKYCTSEIKASFTDQHFHSELKAEVTVFWNMMPCTMINNYGVIQ